MCNSQSRRKDEAYALPSTIPWVHNSPLGVFAYSLSSLFLLSLHSTGDGGIARCWGYRGKSSMPPALLRQKDRQLFRCDSQEAVGVGRGCGQGRLGERELNYLRKREGPPEVTVCRAYLVQTSPSFCRGINGSPERDNDLSRRSSRAKIPLQLSLKVPICQPENELRT